LHPLERNDETQALARLHRHDATCRHYTVQNDGMIAWLRIESSRRSRIVRGLPPIWECKTTGNAAALGLPLHAANQRVIILNQMVQYSRSRLDASFAALSDATRRGVLEQLGRADASITDLAEKFHMTPTGMKKHVGVLEQAGLVRTEKVGRVRTCKLGPRRLQEEMAWIERYRQLWDSRFDELDKIVEELKQKEMVDGRKKRE